jgi:spermidine synthase
MQQAEADSIDIIIVDSTDPVGPGEVLFSEAFYRACHHALRPDGLIVQQSESPLLHRELLKRIYQDMGSAGFAAIRTLQFPQPVYPGGWWSATMAMSPGAWPEPRYTGMEKITGLRYFNRAIFDASLAVPAFMAEE